MQQGPEGGGRWEERRGRRGGEGAGAIRRRWEDGEDVEVLRLARRKPQRILVEHDLRGASMATGTACRKPNNAAETPPRRAENARDVRQHIDLSVEPSARSRPH